jgi:NAD(P)H-nitrite reductase large subunit
MQESGIKLNLGCLPESITKLENGKLRVEFSNGESDVFDTVLAAVGTLLTTSVAVLDLVW